MQPCGSNNYPGQRPFRDHPLIKSPESNQQPAGAACPAGRTSPPTNPEKSSEGAGSSAFNKAVKKVKACLPHISSVTEALKQTHFKDVIFTHIVPVHPTVAGKPANNADHSADSNRMADKSGIRETDDPLSFTDGIPYLPEKWLLENAVAHASRYNVKIIYFDKHESLSERRQVRESFQQLAAGVKDRRINVEVLDAEPIMSNPILRGALALNKDDNASNALLKIMISANLKSFKLKKAVITDLNARLPRTLDIDMGNSSINIVKPHGGDRDASIDTDYCLVKGKENQCAITILDRIAEVSWEYQDSRSFKRSFLPSRLPMPRVHGQLSRQMEIHEESGPYSKDRVLLPCDLIRHRGEFIWFTRELKSEQLLPGKETITDYYTKGIMDEISPDDTQSKSSPRQTLPEYIKLEATASAIEIDFLRPGQTIKHE